MNCIKIVFILFFIPFYSLGQSIEIPDERFKEVLLSASDESRIAYDLNGRKTKIDLNDDGEIQILEAENIAELDLYESGIRNLEGLQYFKNLRRLCCLRNRIDSINIESLPNLIRLNCMHNNLTSIKIGANSNIMDLYCAYNKLTTLNVEGAVSLNTLICQRNQLDELNVNGCVNLVDLRCGANQLEELDLSTNRRLYNLSSGGNKLTTLDLTACQSLQTVFLHQNKLHFIDFQNGLKSEIHEFNINRNSPDLKVCIDASDTFRRLHEDFRTPITSTCGDLAEVASLDIEKIIAQEIAKENIEVGNEIKIYPNSTPDDSYLNESVSHTGKDLTEVANLDIEKIITQEIAKENIEVGNKIKIYPNPVSDNFELSEPVSELLIYDLSGKQCFKRVININNVDVSFLSAGAYIIICIDQQGETHSARLIKK